MFAAVPSGPVLAQPSQKGAVANMHVGKHAGYSGLLQMYLCFIDVCGMPAVQITRTETGMACDHELSLGR